MLTLMAALGIVNNVPTLLDAQLTYELLIPNAKL